MVILLLCYGFAGSLGLHFAAINNAVTPLWAPTGIAIAAMVLYGYRVWPAILLGSLVTGFVASGTPASITAGVGASLAESFLAVYFINKYANGKEVFEKVQTILVFILFAGILSTFVGAIIGAGGLVLFQRIPLQAFPSIWSTWWLGDIGGALLVGPLLILWLRKPIQINLRLLGEYFMFLLLIGVLSRFIFSGMLPYPYFYIPVLVLGAFRFGQRGEAFALFFIACIATISTVYGVGPYAQSTVVAPLLRLELFLTICASTIYIITAALLERQKAQSGLVSSEKRFRSLIEKSYDAIVLIDATSRISYASPSVERVLGYKQAELIGTVGFNLVYPEDLAYAKKELAKILAKPGSALAIQYRSIKKDKKVIWVDVTGTNLLFDGVVNAVVINFHDITESKEAQEQLLKEKVEDDAILASIGEGMVATDATGKITVVNRAACDMLRFTKSELIGKDFISIVSMQDGEKRTIPKEERPMTKVLREKKLYVTSPNNYYVRSDKTKFPVRFTVAPVLLNDQIIGTVEVFRDITHEIEVDRAKSEFVSLASHQLRTPLTTIDWYLERLKEKGMKSLSGEEKEDMEEIYHATNRMVELVNALLNASRLELGTFIANPKSITYESVLKDILRELHAQTTAKKVKIVQDIKPTTIPISADPKLLSIIVENLLSNAVKYSTKGGEVAVSLLFTEKGYTFSVIDRGIGIPKDDQKKIFGKMFRADNAKLVDREGTGLGLYITKSIVDETGGKISFVSAEKKGTTFTVWYPKVGMKKKIGTKELR